MGKIIGVVLGLVVLVMGIGWLAEGNQFFMYSFFAPKYEQTRRNVFEQSRAFNEGMAQELQSMKHDYDHSKDQGEKDAIRSIVQHRVAGYDVDSLNNPDLRAWVKEMQ